MEYHVSKKGSDANPGTSVEPFLTISKAASVAEAGDSVLVHEGVYREHVSPAHSGTEALRILYAAAPGEKAVISGADVVSAWEDAGGGIWKTVLPNSYFGGRNPYAETVFGDWLDVPAGKRYHTGEVFFNGKPLVEAQNLEGLATGQWYCDVGAHTTIYAAFPGNPCEGTVEITVRPFVFFPLETQKSFITVRGFELTKAATNWAPPTAFQGGLIGPHWAKGWVIEDCEISHSKCSGVSLGKEITTGDNEWTRLRFKQGTQREREVIFRAAGGYIDSAPWDKEYVGGHIVRNNVIHDCGQTGIVGHLGGAFSLIEKNHIYNIHTCREWGGAEIGGIKMHAAIDTIIRDNFIHNCFRGLWLDWQAQGTRVSRNVFFDNDAEDLFVEVSHGPYLVDNNIFLSPINYRELSQGGAFCHNLFTGRIVQKAELNRYTPYHFPHDTEVAGVMTISGGDVRYFNNLFAKCHETEHLGEKRIFWMDRMPPTLPADASLEERVNHERGLYVITGAGASCYNRFPGPSDAMPWDNEGEGASGTPHTDAALLPVHFGGNVYTGGALPCAKEKDAVVTPQTSVTIKSVVELVETTITTADLPNPAARIVTTDTLGQAFHPEQRFENPDGTEIVLDTDFFGNPRSEQPTPGPFEGTGEFKIGGTK
jgi:hypothetical protein